MHRECSENMPDRRVPAHGKACVPESLVKDKQKSYHPGLYGPVTHSGTPLHDARTGAASPAPLPDTMTDTVKTPRRAARTRGAKASEPAGASGAMPLAPEVSEAPATPDIVLDAEVLLDPQPEVTPKARAKADSGKSAAGKPTRGRRAASSPLAMATRTHRFPPP